MRFLSTLSWEVRGTATKPLPHLWSAQHNLTRVFAITDHSEECLAPAVERFGRSRPDCLEFVRVFFERSERELDRDCSTMRDTVSGRHESSRPRAFTLWKLSPWCGSCRVPRRRDDPGRCGYFPGIELQAAPPIVYLVAPALRLNPATDRLWRMLTPQLEIVRVGPAENWWRGLRVVLRQ